MTKPRRRQAGEGTISEYATKAGPRYLIKYSLPLEDGSKRQVLKRGFMTRREAAEALTERRASIKQGTHVTAKQSTVGEHLTIWLDGLRLSPSTIASYRKNVRVHLMPTLGSLKLEQVTGTRLTAVYRQLERDGRADGKGGLSARTVRYIHTILHSALSAAVRDGKLSLNPADKAVPPSARQAASPEMKTWTGEELGLFLGWSKARQDELHIAWTLLAMTGMRRGEALGLRWGDIDFDASTIAVRRSAGLIKTHGNGEEVIVGPPKSGKSRVIDIDPTTVAALRAWRSQMGLIALSLARPDAYVLGRVTGEIRHPERFSRAFNSRVQTARAELGEDRLSEIRLHDLRHTSATLLLTAGIHPKIVSERLGHAKVSITLDVYSHAVPTLQREAAGKLASLVYGGTA